MNIWKGHSLSKSSVSLNAFYLLYKHLKFFDWILSRIHHFPPCRQNLTSFTLPFFVLYSFKVIYKLLLYFKQSWNKCVRSVPERCGKLPGWVQMRQRASRQVCKVQHARWNALQQAGWRYTTCICRKVIIINFLIITIIIRVVKFTTCKSLVCIVLTSQSKY